MDLQKLTLDVEQHIEVRAPIEAVFEGLLSRLSERNTKPGDEPMPMCLEQWPGGRWFRDLGEGVGHLWGFVQVIKPPTLLELSGPLFMSYPVTGHLQIRLAPVSGGTKLTLRHRAFGLIEDDHRKGVGTGWQHLLNSVKRECE